MKTLEKTTIFLRLNLIILLKAQSLRYTAWKKAPDKGLIGAIKK